MKTCGRCESDLPVSAFGVDRSRADGLTLYCRECNRIKTIEHRAGKREWVAHQKYLKAKALLIEQGVIAADDWAISVPRRPMVLSRKRKEKVNCQVLKAIRQGARTQEEILGRTKLDEDEIADAIARLMLDQRAIDYDRTSEPRRYFVRAA